METILSNALANSYSYESYRAKLKMLLAENKSSGDEQSADLLHYSQLNETRMNRLDKTLLITPENELFLRSLETPYTWLVLSEGWCGDAAQILPIMHKMAQLSDKIALKIVFRDENLELMNLFLTNGSKSVPKLIIIDSLMKVVADWGPRPADAIKLIVDYKAKFGLIDEIAKAELQMWYLHDKGISTQNEIVALMK